MGSRYQPSHPGKKTTKALLESAETKTEERTEEKKTFDSDNMKA